MSATEVEFVIPLPGDLRGDEAAIRSAVGEALVAMVTELEVLEPVPIPSDYPNLIQQDVIAVRAVFAADTVPDDVRDDQPETTYDVNDPQRPFD